MSLYVCGVLGDQYNQRYVLTVGYCGMTVLYFALSIAGFFDITTQAFYYIVLSGIGTLNATLLPCMISINGNWFPKKSRGFIVGLWATCNNFGNILGS
jgi:sugar phosphate permease